MNEWNIYMPNFYIFKKKRNSRNYIYRYKKQQHGNVIKSMDDKWFFCKMDISQVAKSLDRNICPTNHLVLSNPFVMSFKIKPFFHSTNIHFTKSSFLGLTWFCFNCHSPLVNAILNYLKQFTYISYKTWFGCANPCEKLKLCKINLHMFIIHFLAMGHSQCICKHTRLAMCKIQVFFIVFHIIDYCSQ